MPPETPASTKWMPFSLRLAYRRCESRKFELPPSTIASPSLAQLEQLLERVLGDLARRDHHPERARRVELVAQLLERRRRGVDAAGRTSSRRGRARVVASSCCRPCGRGRSFRAASDDLLRVGRARRGGRAPSAIRSLPRPARGSAARSRSRVRGSAARRPGRPRPGGRGPCSGRPCGAARSNGGSAGRGRA